MTRAPFLVALLALACSAPTPHPPVIGVGEPPYPDDDPVGAGAGDTCALAGRALWRCGCKESGRAGGMTFPAFCRDRGPAINSACIVAARQCPDLTACGVRCLR